ncbi:MAG: ROK family protein [Erysipelotrichaceae bacterium]|nr:ROK family protein [Erysipelotrichaceae bacterium]MBQ2583075.1 ROK family protein [Erysipelotrichaceae bacterium]
MNYYVGIDLGGTNVRIAKVDEEGKLIQDVIAPSHGKEGPEAIEANILELLGQFDLKDVKSIGLAVPGPVDGEKNVITQATNIPGCEGYPFAENMEKITGIPVYLDNDANAAGLAEALLGSGKGYHMVYYLTHSTGIGGALIIEGKVISGHKGYAGEVANVIVDPDAKQYPVYAHLNRGGVESVASGTAIGLMGGELIGEEANSARKVFILASEGNEKAMAIVDRMAKNLATCMAAISAICAPDCFVIGGGCTHSSILYFDKLRNYFYSMAHEELKDVPIIKATLEEPGVLGAAMLGKSHLG